MVKTKTKLYGKAMNKEEIREIAREVNEKIRADRFPSNIFFSKEEELKKLFSLLLFNEFTETPSLVKYMREKVNKAIEGIPIILHPNLEEAHHSYWSARETT